MFYTIFLTLIIYLCLSVLSCNLLDFIVLRHRTTKKSGENGGGVQKRKPLDLTCLFYITNILSFMAAILYYYALYHVFNTGMVVAAGMLMISRLPKYISAKRARDKIVLKKINSRPFGHLSSALSFLALPMVLISVFYPGRSTLRTFTGEEAYSSTQQLIEPFQKKARSAYLRENKFYYYKNRINRVVERLSGAAPEQQIIIEGN